MTYDRTNDVSIGSVVRFDQFDRVGSISGVSAAVGTGMFTKKLTHLFYNFHGTKGCKDEFVDTKR